MTAAVGVFEASYAALLTLDPDEKVSAVRGLWQQWQAGELRVDAEFPVAPVVDPGRPARPELVRPGALKPRKLNTREGQAAMLHAIAHIEFNAINLALDAVYRFRGLPTEYYRDWLGIAAEEAEHFGLVRGRLRTLGFDYGDFPAHNGLWEAALASSDDMTRRMALVPRVFEARGLDVTPSIIAKFRGIGDQASVAVLEVILRDEVGHVAAGDRWFRWGCARLNLPPEATFRAWVRTYLKGEVRGPFNVEARLAAGFTAQELQALATQDGD
ncbi:MAG: ferritin-like domain-containing protein [Thiotrichales bacterium]